MSKLIKNSGMIKDCYLMLLECERVQLLQDLHVILGADLAQCYKTFYVRNLRMLIIS
jgi:hypothetical protein